jgi:hypothetical protein
METDMASISKQIDRLLDQAEELALAEVERRARQVMQKHPTAASFCMVMGSATFYDKHGEPIEEDRTFVRPFYDFVDEFNRFLYLTGNPMNIKGHDGPLITDW